MKRLPIPARRVQLVGFLDIFRLMVSKAHDFFEACGKCDWSAQPSARSGSVANVGMRSLSRSPFAVSNGTSIDLLCSSN